MTTFPTPPPEPHPLRLVATLFVAGLCSGLGLVSVNIFTAPLIAANKAAALERAVLEVVPDSATMQELELFGEGEGGRGKPRVFAAYDGSGQFRGYAIKSQDFGFQDVIELIFGYDPAGQVITGMEVLASKETPGLGDKIYKDEEFVAQFEALAVEPSVELVKKGKKSAPNQVEAITGATISSRAVVEKIIRSACQEVLELLPRDPPPAPAPPPPPSDGEGGER